MRTYAFRRLLLRALGGAMEVSMAAAQSVTLPWIVRILDAMATIQQGSSIRCRTSGIRTLPQP